MTNCIHCDIAERYSNPDTKISNTYDILWVGISAKIGEKPLSETTNTGKLVKQIEAACGIRPIWSNVRQLIRMES